MGAMMSLLNRSARQLKGNKEERGANRGSSLPTRGGHCCRGTLIRARARSLSPLEINAGGIAFYWPAQMKYFWQGRQWSQSSFAAMFSQMSGSMTVPIWSHSMPVMQDEHCALHVSYLQGHGINNNKKRVRRRGSWISTSHDKNGLNRCERENNTIESSAP